MRNLLSLINTWLWIFFSLQLIGCATKPIDPNPPPVSKPTTTGKPKPIPPSTYIVKRGEGLYAIASRHGLDYRIVATWNGIAPPYNLYPGQVLRLQANIQSNHASSPRQPSHQMLIPNTDSSTQSSVSEGPLPKDYASNKWIWPTQGKVVQTFVKGRRTRQGIRIAGTAGQSIVAAESGRVIYSDDGLPSYGQLVIIKHSKNYLSAYGFNRKILTKEGKTVSQGEQIAEMGYSTDGKPMLHFEIRRGGTALNPIRLLPRR